MTAVVVALICLVSMAAPSVRAVHYRVGDSSGWSQDANLTSWASAHTFTVGDALEFKYSRAHGVQVVSKDDYDNCNTSNPRISIGSTQGKTTFSLDQAGPMYFICPTPGHCQAGMKLAINVIPAGNGNVPTNPTGSGIYNRAATDKPSGGLVLGFSLVVSALVVVLG